MEWADYLQGWGKTHSMTKTSSMWSAFEGLDLQIENKKGEDARLGPWNEIFLSLARMIKGPPTLEFLEEKKSWTCKYVATMVALWQKKIVALKIILHSRW
jgi:hypothetical protein